MLQRARKTGLRIIFFLQERAIEKQIRGKQGRGLGGFGTSCAQTLPRTMATHEQRVAKWRRILLRKEEWPDISDPEAERAALGEALQLGKMEKLNLS